MPTGDSFACWPVLDLGVSMHIHDCAQKPRAGSRCVQRTSTHSDPCCCLQGCCLTAGRLNGKLRLVSNDLDSWRFPIIKGRIRGHDLGFHFFDAPDDFSKTKLDLLFEGDRLYLHGAQGHFGAVPLTLTGMLLMRPSKLPWH